MKNDEDYFTCDSDLMILLLRFVTHYNIELKLLDFNPRESGPVKNGPVDFSPQNQ